VILGDGWFAGTLGPDGRRGHFGPGPTRFKGQLEIVQNDGNTLIIPTDDTWKGATGPILESDLYNGEVFDARKDLGDWDEPLFAADASTWKPVIVLTDRNPIITAEETPPIKVTEELKPVALTEPKPGTWIRFKDVSAIEAWGYVAKLEIGTPLTLHAYLKRSVPCVLAVHTSQLPYYPLPPWDAHSIVLVGEDRTTYTVLDPAQNETPIRIARRALERAWRAGEFRMYAIRLPDQPTVG
jgi:hypothetical protein